MKQLFSAYMLIILTVPFTLKAQISRAADKSNFSFLTLKVSRLTENTNQLFWQMNSEKDVLQFEVERSGDASKFTTVGLIFTEENGASALPRLFDDVMKTPCSARTYYRLKIVATEGRNWYSAIVPANRQPGMN